jgi:hypothetical protein
MKIQFNSEVGRKLLSWHTGSRSIALEVGTAIVSGEAIAPEVAEATLEYLELCKGKLMANREEYSHTEFLSHLAALNELIIHIRFKLVSELIASKSWCRDHECLRCGHQWTGEVKQSISTPNASGEATPWCTNCGSKSVVSNPMRELR